MVCEAFGRVEVDIPVAMTLNTQSERLCIGCSMPVYPSVPKVCLISVCYMLIVTRLPSLKMTMLPREIYFPSMKIQHKNNLLFIIDRHKLYMPL